jgi:hypothetical protein
VHNLKLEVFGIVIVLFASSNCFFEGSDAIVVQGGNALAYLLERSIHISCFARNIQQSLNQNNGIHVQLSIDMSKIN